MEVGLRSTRCFWPNGLSGAGAKMTLRTRSNKTLEPLILDVFFLSYLAFPRISAFVYMKKYIAALLGFNFFS